MANVLLVDLNNFARYPTLSVGYLCSILRKEGHSVEVFAPLMMGVKGVQREQSPTPWGYLSDRINYLVATASSMTVRKWRNAFAGTRLSGIRTHEDSILESLCGILESRHPELVLISTYLMYHKLCERICAQCSRSGIPVLVGGPYFTQPATIDAWARMPGLTALVCGEVETNLPRVVDSVLSGEDATSFPGFVSIDRRGILEGQIAQPLNALDLVPFPDYSDFPWSLYPNRILPVITGRGCSWGACGFCSDVSSSAGRTYRSRSLPSVLAELSQHWSRHGINRFVFTDLKLNSFLPVWRGLIEGLPGCVPDAQWIGNVHVGSEDDNGLSAADLQRAADSGCVRLSTGLESGSQRLLDRMKKGVVLERVSRFLRHAGAAGISCRCTMIVGYPDETPEDVRASIEFLKRHEEVIERVTLNRLQVIPGTPLYRELKTRQAKPGCAGASIETEDHLQATCQHHYGMTGTWSHRLAVLQLLSIVHRINRKPLNKRAAEFEGVM